jgi:transcriptional regulator with XRE-family HTH domain
MTRTEIKSASDIGKVIREARKEKKLTINEVSYKAGFSPATLINIEQNRGSVRTDTLLAIAKVVGVTIELVTHSKVDKIAAAVGVRE